MHSCFLFVHFFYFKGKQSNALHRYDIRGVEDLDCNTMDSMTRNNIMFVPLVCSSRNAFHGVAHMSKQYKTVALNNGAHGCVLF